MVAKRFSRGNGLPISFGVRARVHTGDVQTIDHEFGGTPSISAVGSQGDLVSSGRCKKTAASAIGSSGSGTPCRHRPGPLMPGGGPADEGDGLEDGLKGQRLTAQRVCQRGQTHAMTPRVNTEEPIDAHEVAAILGLRQFQSVSTYQRRYADMPRPAVDLGPGRPRLWLRPEILTWARKTGRCSRGQRPEQCVARLNAASMKISSLGGTSCSSRPMILLAPQLKLVAEPQLVPVHRVQALV
jgi:hypothetical protein